MSSLILFASRSGLAAVIACVALSHIPSAIAGVVRSVGTACMFGNVTPKRLLSADEEPGEWITGGRDYQQTYYSPLTDINRHNVRDLGLAWTYSVDSARLSATPIVVDGTMFTSGNSGSVYAIDAATGVPRWTFHPDIDPGVFRRHCCGGINRGVAVWRGKVYVGSLDGYLYALDAGNGMIVWRADTIVDRSRAYTSTGAPYIANEAVVIGNSGAEYDARGYITAFNSQTGRQLWRFFTVPGDPKKGFEHPELEMAAKTWDPNSLWEVGLGGTVWDGMAYDPRLNLLYIGTGNGLPYPRSLRSPRGGDNLFLSSILAINPDTGRLAWHYQTTPGESWDYTATQKLVLADLRLADGNRKVIMQAPKNGFFYVLDRISGELLSAKPFARVNWASHVDMATGRPVETGEADYSKAPKIIFPNGLTGAHSWHPMAFNPQTGLVYIPVLERPDVIGMGDQPFEYKKTQTNLGARWLSRDHQNDSQDFEAHLFLRAWDPIKQKLAWEVETTGGVPVTYTDSGGVMSTASDLVFQGRKDGHLYVFDARTGAELFSFDVGTSIAAAPMSYRVNGDQYIAMMASPSSAAKDRTVGRILALKLGGRATQPIPPTRETNQDSSTRVTIRENPEQIARGRRLYERHCALCHSRGEIAPNLTKMDEQAHAEFKDIVLKGTRLSKGMGNFSDVLSQSDAESIHAYIIYDTGKKYEKGAAKH